LVTPLSTSHWRALQRRISDPSSTLSCSSKLTGLFYDRMACGALPQVPEMKDERSGGASDPTMVHLCLYTLGL
jgi:hypothetical protein